MGTASARTDQSSDVALSLVALSCDPAMRRFRELQDDDIIRAAALVELWGYPREIHALEIEYGTWVEYGRECVLWYTPIPDSDDLAAHICIAPAARGNLSGRRLAAGIEIIAQLLGAQRVWSYRCPGEDPKMVEYLLRLGFVADNGGLVRHLGDE